MPPAAGDVTPRPHAPPPARRRVPESRPPFRDNLRLILGGIGLLLIALVAMIALADRSAELSPDFLTEVVLYALSAADVTMLVALGFVLARNIIKLLVERRRALPFARFRAKLVGVLLGMTIIPALLVLLVGSELIRNSVDRWFSAPIDEVLNSSTKIASEYYHDRQTRIESTAEAVARSLAHLNLVAADVGAVRSRIAPEITQRRADLVEVYSVVPRHSARPDVAPLVDVAVPTLPRGYVRASGDRLAARALSSGGAVRAVEPLGGNGELVRSAVTVRTRGGVTVGVVVASDYLEGELASSARRITAAYEGYSQLRVLKRPLAGVYLSFFLMVTLMILVSATWMGLYLAKRITRPVLLLADGAREIGAGHLDHRIERETADELGTLVDAFNTMAGELAASQQKLEDSRRDLEGKNLEAEARRRYIETILERIATGVISVDAAGRVSTVNAAASRLLGLDMSIVGRPASEVFSRPDLQPLGAFLLRRPTRAEEQPAHEVAIARDGRELHLAAAATVLQGEGDAPEGAVLVFDDVTPLIRAQRVSTWRDVARRLAHEIKNPLTPIQLCADRMRRHFSTAPAPQRALVEECTRTIVGEVESLKNLVDEFSQFARMPPPRTVPLDLHQLLRDSLALYNGLFQDLRIETAFAPDLPHVRVDPEQIRRVVINLVDNAVEALRGQHRTPNGAGRISVDTQYDPGNGLVRILVADNGPGIPVEDRDKLFMPYYSTKRRGSGLGLAIVRRIIAEHGGSIEVGDNTPHGTRFTIELPAGPTAVN